MAPDPRPRNPGHGGDRSGDQILPGGRAELRLRRCRSGQGAGAQPGGPTRAQKRPDSCRDHRGDVAGQPPSGGGRH